jgi:hypothetical protein
MTGAGASATQHGQSHPSCRASTTHVVHAGGLPERELATEHSAPVEPGHTWAYIECWSGQPNSAPRITGLCNSINALLDRRAASSAKSSPMQPSAKARKPQHRNAWCTTQSPFNNSTLDVQTRRITYLRGQHSNCSCRLPTPGTSRYPPNSDSVNIRCRSTMQHRIACLQAVCVRSSACCKSEHCCSSEELFSGGVQCTQQCVCCRLIILKHCCRISCICHLRLTVFQVQRCC